MKLVLTYNTFLICFFFLFWPVYRFISIEPYLVWLIDKQNIENSVSDDFYATKISNLKKKYFKYNNTVTFYENNGEIISQNKIQKDMICGGGTGEIGTMLYFPNGERIYFLSEDEGIAWEYKTYSYPFLTLNNNIILLLTGENAGHGILNTQGDVLAEPVSSGMFSTTFDISSKTNIIIIGYINGNIKIFNENLEELWFKKFSDSRINIVKKVSASSKGNYFAVLSGLEPECLNILNKNGTPEFKYLTGENRRRPVEMKFSGNEKYLIEESEMGFRLYSLKKKKLIQNKQLFDKLSERQLISVDISYDGKFIIVSYKKSKTVSAIALFDNEGCLYFQQFFEDELPFVAFSFTNYNFLVEIKNKIHLYGI